MDGMEKPIRIPLADAPSRRAPGLQPPERSIYLDNIFISDRIGLFSGEFREVVAFF
jgi:hypothetical protein